MAKPLSAEERWMSFVEGRSRVAAAMMDRDQFIAIIHAAEAAAREEMRGRLDAAEADARLWQDIVSEGVSSATVAAREMRERCAKVADLYAETNLEAAGDTIFLDPILRGKGFSAENMATSDQLTIDGCIHSSMHHAAKNIAAAIRALSLTPSEDKTDAS